MHTDKYIERKDDGMNILKWMDKNLERVVCVTLFMIISFIMIVNVIMRFVFKNAIPWASDLVLFIFVWFVWFAISFGIKEGAHVNVTAIISLFSGRTQKKLQVLTNIIAMIFFVLLAYFGTNLLSHESVVGKTGLLIPYPMWSIYLAPVVGLFLTLIRLIQDTKRIINELKSNDGGVI